LELVAQAELKSDNYIMPIEKTLMIVKPDAMRRRITGKIMDRVEATGLELIGAKVVRATRELIEKHYIAHKNESFFENLVQYMLGKFHGYKQSRLLALVYKGENAISTVRKVVGATNPEEAEPGTIRNSFGRVVSGRIENVVHASGNLEDSEYEIWLWFNPGEIVE
jgi:nucleoside-diphosphate kinase